MLHWGRALGTTGNLGGSRDRAGIGKLAQCGATMGPSVSPLPAASPGSGQRVLLEKSLCYQEMLVVGTVPHA